MSEPLKRTIKDAIFYAISTLGCLWLFENFHHTWQLMTAVITYGLFFCNTIAQLCVKSYSDAFVAPD